jgi:hypothetical protein
MPSEGRRGGELGFPNSHLVDSLDEVAKGLAAGTISRGRAIKLGGAALLGSMGLLSLFPGKAGAEGCARAYRPSITRSVHHYRNRRANAASVHRESASGP